MKKLYKAMYEEMSEQERNVVTMFQKKLCDIFDAKCELKERKRKQRKENTSPAPLPKEKENKEKEQKNTHRITREASENDSFFWETRREAFRKECLRYVGKYATDELTNFFYYWSDDSNKQGLVRWELEKTWEIRNLPEIRMNNGFAASDAVAAIRLKHTKHLKRSKDETRSSNLRPRARQSTAEIQAI